MKTINNTLVGPQVLDAMAKTFESATGPLAERLLSALEAGDRVGGDKRGRQSAYLLVVQGTAQTDTFKRAVHNLAVDDHEHPIEELRRLLTVSNSRTLYWDSFDAFEAKDLKRALQLAEAAARLTPAVTERMWFAYLLYAIGEPSRALAEFRSARASDPARFDREWLLYATLVSPSHLLRKLGMAFDWTSAGAQRSTKYVDHEHVAGQRLHHLTSPSARRINVGECWRKSGRCASPPL